VLGGNLQLAASIAVARGNHAEARQLLEEATDLLQRGSGGALRPWRFNPLVLDAARIELAEGKPDTALDQLARFKPWPDEESPTPRPDDVDRLALTAQAHLQRGDLPAAQASAKAAVDGAATVAARGRRPGAEADAALAYGMVLLESGQPHAALPHLERALTIRREFDDPTSPWIAQAEALHGQALLRAGQRPAAQEAAARAKAIVKAHPALSLAFTRPAAKLEDSLKS
jgi:tetratricopeptide (TPR) repeat protein